MVITDFSDFRNLFLCTGRLFWSLQENCYLSDIFPQIFLFEYFYRGHFSHIRIFDFFITYHLLFEKVLFWNFLLGNS